MYTPCKHCGVIISWGNGAGIHDRGGRTCGDQDQYLAEPVGHACAPACGGSGE